MSDETVGYKKPPLHSRFKPGNNANPQGRGARKKLKTGDLVLQFFSKTESVLNSGKAKSMTRQEGLVRKMGNDALMGNLESASLLLDIRERSIKIGDMNSLVIILSKGDMNL